MQKARLRVRRGMPLKDLSELKSRQAREEQLQDSQTRWAILLQPHTLYMIPHTIFLFKYSLSEMQENPKRNVAQERLC